MSANANHSSPTSPAEQPTLLRFGVIGPAHGVRGECVVDTRDAQLPAGVDVPEGLELESAHPSYPVLTIERMREHKHRLLVTFSEISDRTTVETLRGTELRVPAEAIPASDSDELFPEDLIGWSVFLATEPTQAPAYGVVTDVLAYPHQDLLVIQSPHAQEPVLVPFVPEIVPEVDLDEEYVVIDPPQGLLTLEEEASTPQAESISQAEPTPQASPQLRVDVISIFPEYLAPLELSLLGKAQEQGLMQVQRHDLRDHTFDRHHTVDDTPYGGGPGMVMLPEPWGLALDEVAATGSAGRPPTLVIPTPSGARFTQAVAAELAQHPWLIFACGRYEGIDSRVTAHYRQHWPVYELSIGDYVLAGGEVAALVMVEAISRLVPGVLGNAASVTDDSFAPGPMENLLEGPVYTKPRSWRGLEVPEVLLSGDHAKIAAWRYQQAVERTRTYRPDLDMSE